MLKNLREVVVQKWLYLKINIGRMPIETSLLISTTYIFHDHRFRPRFSHDARVKYKMSELACVTKKKKVVSRLNFTRAR
jgi:hypothetical protein